MAGAAAAAADGESYLLLRRGGGLWGVAHAAVRGLSRQGSGYRVEVGQRALLADEVVGVVAGLRVRPAAAAMRRFWPEAACGLAVHETGPLVIVDPASPPRALTAELEPPSAGQRPGAPDQIAGQRPGAPDQIAGQGPGAPDQIAGQGPGASDGVE